MKTFSVSIKGDEVWCDVDKVRVQRGQTKVFDVRLDKTLVTDYKLHVRVPPKQDPEHCIHVQQISDKLVKLIDNNRAPGEIKFDIELVPFPNSNKGTVKPLDPIIVNEN